MCCALEQAQASSDDGDLDDSDLVASTISVYESQQGHGSDGTSQQRGAPTATVFASLSLGISRANHMLANAFEAYSRQAVCRRSLSRPSRRQ